MGFRVFSFHENGTEKASVQTSLAADAIFGIDCSLEAARGYEFVRVGQAPIHAAIPAAIADDVIHLLTIVGDVYEPLFFGQAQELQSLLLGEGSPGPPLQSIICGPVDLDANLYGLAAFPVDDPAGTRCDRQIPGLVDDFPDVLKSQNLSFGFNRRPYRDDPDHGLGEKSFDNLSKLAPLFIHVFFPEVVELFGGSFPEDGAVVKLRDSLDPIVPGISFFF